MCCPDNPIRVVIKTDSYCKCNCQSSCCPNFFTRKKNKDCPKHDPKQIMIINEIGKEALNKN